MTELQQTRYDHLMRRVGDLKGPGSKVANVLDDLFPVTDVENQPLENLAPMGTRLAASHVSIAAGGAGFFTTSYLRNPGGSGVICTVLGFFLDTSSSQVIRFGLSQNSDNAVGTPQLQDGRIFGQGTVIKTQGNNNFLVAGGGAFFLNVSAGTGVLFAPERGICVVTPGTSLQVSNQTVNSSQVTSFWWTERIAQPSELVL